MKSLARAVHHKLMKFRRSMNALHDQGNKLDFRETYLKLVDSLKHAHDFDKAMQLSVGGEFEAIGILEVETLKYFGLKENSYLIDVGCGSGRLAIPLSKRLKGRYLGIDIVPELVDYARQKVGKSDWRFETAEGLKIPEKSETADMVCFFSVFTHLLHEQSYLYLEEAMRVLKPGGKIVFSFLDFIMAGHWTIFEANLNDVNNASRPLNVFICKDAIHVWADHLGLEITTLADGDKPLVPLSEPIVFENGSVMENVGTFGQSICVLRKGGGTEAGE